MDLGPSETLGPSEISGKTRVLVVEDDATQARILQLGLATADFRADVVSNGLAAVGIAAARHYDAVIVDYNIPEIDGLATARLLGDLLGSVDRPLLIALTATPDCLAARESGKPSAFDLVLDKSSDLSTIIGAITRGLETAPDASTRPPDKAPVDDRNERARSTASQRSATDAGDPPSLRILVVEDDETQRMLLSSILRRKGYAVETASNGLQAIRRIRENCCDLAVVDYRLPEIDGLGVASLVNDQMAPASRPRLVAVTSTPDVLYAKTAVTGPIFDRIVDKSLGLPELINSVDHMLRFSTNPETRRAAMRILTTDIKRASCPA